MRYSLMSRFQGAFLGLAWGELCGSEPPRSPSLTAAAGPRAVRLPGSQQAIAHTTTLLQTPYGREPVWVPTRVESGAELAIAALPMLLLGHDNAFQLRQQLQQTVTAWGGDVAMQAEVLAVGYLLARIFRERLDPATVLPKLQHYLQRDHPAGTLLHPLLGSQLEAVQTLVQQRAALATAIATLQPAPPKLHSASPIALALYCFLSTPDDLELAVNRATRTCPMPHLVGAIVGLLAGAHHGLAGIPLSWQLHRSRWVVEEPPLTQLVTQLLAVWSGASEWAVDERQGQPVAIAAPGVIRPR